MTKYYIIINWNNNHECHSNNNNDSKHKLSQPWRKKTILRLETEIFDEHCCGLKTSYRLLFDQPWHFFSLIADYSKLIWSFGHKFRHRFNRGIHSTIRSVANQRWLKTNTRKKERKQGGRWDWNKIIKKENKKSKREYGRFIH